MKKTFTMIGCGLALLLSAQFSVAQSGSAGNQAEVSPAIGAVGTANPTVMALFDIQFDLDITAACGSAGLAGVVYVNNEFWVSEWQSDTVWRVDATGNLLGNYNIPTGTGGGIRAMTTDGSFVYASQNGPNIVKIDASNGTVVGTISAALAGVNVRSITYDATTNGGAGGFWISNYGTDIIQIDMAGNPVNFVPASSHTLTGMYGTAFDNISSATNQYLWVFNQAGTTSAPLAEIWQVDIASGVLTGTTFEVNAALGGTVGLAGGICIGTGLAAQPSLCAMLQDNPGRVIGLELTTFSGINENGAENSVSVFPIPANDVINFVVNNSTANEVEVKMFNVQGGLVKSLRTAPGKISIDVKDLAAGLYTVEIMNGDSRITRKFTVN